MLRWFCVLAVVLGGCDSDNLTIEKELEEVDVETNANEEVDADGDGFTPSEGDCDDTDSAIHPEANDDVGDGIDQDCDGNELCFADADDDGLLLATTPTVISNDLDCNDAFEGTHDDPTGDCDDTDPNVGLPSTWYGDLDGDGMGDADDAMEACEQPENYVDNDIDPCVTHDGSAGGSGTSADPFVICDANTLQRIDADLGAHYVQTTDIDLSEALFTPLAFFDIEAALASDDEPGPMGFVGQYDGDGYSIFGLTINETGDDDDESNGPAALFRTVGAGGIIKNLYLEDVDVQGNAGAAVVAGDLMGTIRDVHVRGIINISGSGYVGGLAGRILAADAEMLPEIIDVSIGAGNVTNNGLAEPGSASTGTGAMIGDLALGVGGIVGTAFGGSVTNANAEINVTWSDASDARINASTHTPSAGGAVGRTFSTTLSNVHTAGNVSGIHYVGGVAGEAFAEPSEPCAFDQLTASGDVRGVGANVGGVAGQLNASGCQLGSMGSVSGSYWVGGIAGRNTAEAHCNQCFSSATITAVDGGFDESAGIGGLWGYTDGSGSLTESIFTGKITGTGLLQFGGLVGVSVVEDGAVFEANNNMMMGTVEPETGGLVIAAVLNFGEDATLSTPYFSNNVFVDLDADRAPEAAHSTSMEFPDLYWGEPIALDGLGDVDSYPDAFDFGSTWSFATTTAADSPLYALAHPILEWQCAHDTSIVCDTLD